MDEQRQKLKVKLAANQQRLARLKYLESLPEKLNSHLAECLFIQSPHLDEINSIFWIRPEGVGMQLYQPVGYTYREFSWPKQVISAACSVGDKHDEEEAYFWPFEDNPLYQVKFGWVSRNLTVLFQWEKSDFITGYGPIKYRPGHLGVVTTDLAAAIIISHHIGYLQEDPNPSEVVYQLAYWGF